MILAEGSSLPLRTMQWHLPLDRHAGRLTRTGPKMTLCIAARCYEKPGPGKAVQTAVVSCDELVNDGVWQANIGRKFIGLGPRWCALIAGGYSSAVELARAVGRALPDRDEDFAEDTVVERVSRAAKRFAIRKHIAGTYGVEYDETMPGLADALRVAIVDDAKSVPMPTDELIVVGWAGSAFLIVGYYQGQVAIEDSFAVVGSGADYARITLWMREQKALAALPQTVYALYEAQRIGSKALGVGSKAEMYVLRYDEPTQCITTESVNGSPGGFLDKTFQESLRPSPRVTALPDGVLAGRQMKMFSVDR